MAKRRSKFVHTLGGRMGRTQKALLSPIEHLRNLLCNENLVAQQKVELKDLYTKCLTRDEEVKGYTYFLQDNLLFYEKGAETKIMLPRKFHLVWNSMCLVHTVGILFQRFCTIVFLTRVSLFKSFLTRWPLDQRVPLTRCAH